MDHAISQKEVQVISEEKTNGKKKKKFGRRRRGKKDVILNLSKHPKRIAKANFGADFPNDTQKNTSSKKGKNKKKLCLTTNSKDYDGQLGLPETVEQREFETTGEFFRRLDRLVAKAKVEANLDARFDTKISRKQ